MALGGFLVHLLPGACGFGWPPSPFATWSLWLWVASLSTCHLELVALGGFLVYLPPGVCGFGWPPSPFARRYITYLNDADATLHI